MATVIKRPNISCKLLGVHIDDNLNFSKHVTSLCKKTSKQIAIIRRFKKLLSTRTKLLLYKAYILPHFTYCSTVWMHCSKTAAGKREKLNERAMRCIFNDNISTYDELLVKANMPSLQNRRIQRDMCILKYKIIYATTSTLISGLLSLRSNECNLRGKMKLVLPRANTSKYGLHTFRYYSPKMWNFLRDELRTAPTIKHFVSQIRKTTFVLCCT